MDNHFFRSEVNWHFGNGFGFKLFSESYKKLSHECWIFFGYVVGHFVTSWYDIVYFTWNYRFKVENFFWFVNVNNLLEVVTSTYWFSVFQWNFQHLLKAFMYLTNNHWIRIVLSIGEDWMHFIVELGTDKMCPKSIPSKTKNVCLSLLHE